MEPEVMPDWAVARSRGDYMGLGVQLPTRDGRKTGNAHVIDNEWRGNLQIAVVLTDAGHVMRLARSQLMTLFHPPKWVSSIDEVKNRFMRVDSLLEEEVA
jgi:hypothetical protein